MNIKVNGKELFELSLDELNEVGKEVRLAYLHAKQRSMEEYQEGDRVRFNRNGDYIEGVIETVSSRSLAVNTGQESIIVSPKMVKKVS